jgi:hypothetical protein
MNRCMLLVVSLTVSCGALPSSIARRIQNASPDGAYRRTCTRTDIVNCYVATHAQQASLHTIKWTQLLDSTIQLLYIAIWGGDRLLGTTEVNSVWMPTC